MEGKDLAKYSCALIGFGVGAFVGKKITEHYISDSDTIAVISKSVFEIGTAGAGAAFFSKIGEKTYEALSDAPSSDVAKMALASASKVTKAVFDAKVGKNCMNHWQNTINNHRS